MDADILFVGSISEEHISIHLLNYKLGRGFFGVADLYTSELGTSTPPELGTTRLASIRIRQNRHRYNMEYRK